MVFGFGTCEETRKKMESLVAQGMEGYFGHKVFNIVYDIPAMYGIDADHPRRKATWVNVAPTSPRRKIMTKSSGTGNWRPQLLPDHRGKLSAGPRSNRGRCREAGEDSDALRGNSMNWYPGSPCRTSLPGAEARLCPDG